jgi:hypothetical protein
LFLVYEAGAVGHKRVVMRCLKYIIQRQAWHNYLLHLLLALSQIQGVIKRLPMETSGIQRMCTDLSMDGEVGFPLWKYCTILYLPDASDEISSWAVQSENLQVSSRWPPSFWCVLGIGVPYSAPQGVGMTCYDHVRETCHSLWNTRGIPMWMNASLLWDGSSFWCMILLILLMCLSHFNSFVFRDPGCCKAEPDTAPDSPALSVQFQRDSSDLSQSMSQECRPEMGLLRPGSTAYMYI